MRPQQRGIGLVVAREGPRDERGLALAGGERQRELDGVVGGHLPFIHAERAPL